MGEVIQYLHGRRSILQRELMHLEGKVRDMKLEINALKESIEYQQQLSKQVEEVT